MNPHQEEGSGLHVSRLPHRSSGDCLLLGEETASEYWDNPLQKPFLSLSLSPLAFASASQEKVKQLQGPFYLPKYRRNK